MDSDWKQLFIHKCRSTFVAKYATYSAERGILNEDGTIEFNIFNETREALGLNYVISARAFQIDQWEDVIGNVKEFLGKDASGKSKVFEMIEHLEEYKYDENKPSGKGDFIKSTTESIDE